jgi:uncharacterized protein (DUF1800 family)
MEKQIQLTHLYWRAGFGLSPNQWDRQKDWSIDKAVSELFKAAQLAAPLQKPSFLSEEDLEKKSEKKQNELRKQARQMVFQQNVDWIKRMASAEQPSLLEKMTLFWHGHFACTTKMPTLSYQQLQTIRTHALGNFRAFVHAMSKDVAMIRYLNNQQNKKTSPNENFARELMELFTIGRGHYTEKDVKEAARAFTGWRGNKRGEFAFKEKDHDFGEKMFMKTKGKLNGEDIVNTLLDQKQTAHFITTKIFRFFVNEKVDEKIVATLADRFYKNNYDIEDLMKTIFSSDWFYAGQHIGNRIKSPVELMAGIIRQLDVVMEDAESFRFIQKALGQRLFDPPNVAGWPGGKSWIDNSTLMLRLNLVNYLYGKTEINFKIKEELESQNKGQAFRRIDGKITFTELLSVFRSETRSSVFEELNEFLLQVNNRPDKSSIEPFVISDNQEDYIKSLALRLMTLPEYQLC